MNARTVEFTKQTSTNTRKPSNDGQCALTLVMRPTNLLIFVVRPSAPSPGLTLGINRAISLGISSNEVLGDWCLQLPAQRRRDLQCLLSLDPVLRILRIMRVNIVNSTYSICHSSHHLALLSFVLATEELAFQIRSILTTSLSAQDWCFQTAETSG